MSKKKRDPVRAAAMRDHIIEEWLVLALECFLAGDCLGDRHRLIFDRALQRVAMNAAIQAADQQLREVEDRKRKDHPMRETPRRI